MKKVLFMVSSMNIGGVEKSLLSLLDTISPTEYDVTVLMLEKKGGFLDLMPKWVKVEEVQWFSQVKSILMEAPNKTVKKYLEKKEIIPCVEFIWSYYKTKLSNNRMIFHKQLLKSIPHYPQAFDIAIAYPGPTELIDCYILNKVEAPIKVQWIHFDLGQVSPNQKLYEQLFKEFNKVFVVSNEAKDKLLNLYRIDEKKVETFPNIVSDKLVHKLASEEIQLDPTYKGIKLLTVGRLAKEKGQDLAINALKRLKEEGYSVRWYCIGDGNAKAEYEQIIKAYHLEEDFLLLGSKTNPYPYMNQADIYVQTSRHEGYCLTLAEARCLNKPIITTNFTGAKEQIKNGQTGMIIKGTEEALYEAVRYVIEHPEERIRLSDNLRRDAGRMNENTKCS
ncbi:glycosyltransferase [Niameybacter massiliensis]|uniref:glycosyltransferase n=1 Tax=Niameybacter massiliensis TaxID=1658108 RepID=UPI0006B55875|nr:glycosyltransferase [Niameybacter massiliensis]